METSESGSTSPASRTPPPSAPEDDMSVAPTDLSAEMKPKGELMESQQKIKKLVRRNASDKLKLIQMVHDNPILWDSRLPNFKGAEEEKNRAWEQIGKHFNAPGRRVARAFKSLRESYRRELAHVKIMGNGFKPKWSLYEAMDFLRDVIRERKSDRPTPPNHSPSKIKCRSPHSVELNGTQEKKLKQISPKIIDLFGPQHETAKLYKGGSHATDQSAIGLNLSAFSQHINNNNYNLNNNNNSNNNNNNNNAVITVNGSAGTTLNGGNSAPFTIQGYNDRFKDNHAEISC
ncbi:homeobox protein 2-like [Teleopsis dalmanni]|uniref:homeobox protein 2-like n=1 Tax=Teleopsis dalmanni TaxID=139649 RepID=UPI0018CD0315|nr:homeobox protein 2-like [Teleopsis dalmanni]